MKSTFQISLNADQFEAMAAKLKAMGFGPDQMEKGTLPETRSVVLSYSVDVKGAPWPPTMAIVTFTIEKKPFVASAGMVESALKKMMGIS
jgi:hypothetical protein